MTYTEVYTLILINSSKSKVTPPSSEQCITDLPWISETWGLWMAGFKRTGWCNVYIHRIRGRATWIDGWQRFVLLRTQIGVTGSRCPRACISVADSVSIQLSISGHLARLYATAVTSVYSHNVCLLLSDDVLHNDSICSTDASQREQRVSDSKSCIYGR